MSDIFPQPFHSTVDGPVSVSLSPSTFTINSNVTLPVMHFSIDQIPKMTFGFDPIEVRLTKIPSTRSHLPVDLCLSMTLFGLELMAWRICGETQVITEDYHPNPCEHCGADSAGTLPPPGQIP